MTHKNPTARLQLLALASILVFTTSSIGCRGNGYGDRGLVLGGLAGALTGAAIGDGSGNALPGAVVGSAVGAFTGAAIGDGIDADLARSQAEIEARMGRRISGAATIEDVIAMSKAGLSDEVINTHIRASGVSRPLAVNDLIALRDQGVSDAVIKTMQQTPQPTTAQPVAYAPAGGSRQVIVEHHYDTYCPPPPPFWYHHHPRHCGPPRRPGVAWGFSIAR